MNKRLLHELLDVVIDLQKTGDYACLDVGNYGTPVTLYHTSGGWNQRGYDRVMHMSTEDKLEDAIQYCRTVKKEAPGAGKQSGT